MSSPNYKGSSNHIDLTDPCGGNSAGNGETAGETLLNLTTLLDELATAGQYEFLIEITLNALQSHKKDDIVCLCLDMVTRICKEDKTNKERIGNNETMVEELVFALKNFGTSENVQTKASSAMACVSGDSKARSVLVQSGACRLLVQILQAQTQKPGESSEEIVSAVVSALRGLSAEASARESFRLLMASNYICKAMNAHISSTTLQRDACAFLSNTSVNIETQEVFPVSCDVFQAMIDALRKHQTEDKVVSVACFALLNLTCEESNLRVLRSIEGIFDLFDQSSDDGTSEMWNYQDAYELLDRLQMSKAADESLEEQAQESLHVMIALKDSKPEVIPEVVDLLNNFDWSSRIARECCKLCTWTSCVYHCLAPTMILICLLALLTFHNPILSSSLSYPCRRILRAPNNHHGCATRSHSQGNDTLPEECCRYR